MFISPTSSVRVLRPLSLTAIKTRINGNIAIYTFSTLVLYANVSAYHIRSLQLARNTCMYIWYVGRAGLRVKGE